MKTVLDVLDLSDAFLKERGVVRSRREAEELLADVLAIKRLDLYLQFERPLTEEELAKARIALKRRGEGEPLQYISGKVDFADVEIGVNPSVLIPRPETELLVERISQVLENRIFEGKVLWDVCCGSGCIGIALKHRFPELKVILSDLSEEALAVALDNAERNEVAVEVRHGDLFGPFDGEQCHFFVSNPPYVSEEEYEGLSKEVKQEPKMALVGGTKGLHFYQRIAEQLDSFLEPHGCAWMEIGAGQGESVKSLFGKGVVERDWAGLDRFFSLEKD